MGERYELSRLKRAVPIVDVLAHYGLEGGLRAHHGELVGPCPLPQHAGDRDNRGAFRVNPHKGVWHCLSHCGGGDLVRLVALLEGRRSSAAARALATLEGNASRASPTARSRRPPPAATATFRPYTRQLRLDPRHPFLQSRRIAPETAHGFEAGAWPLGGFLERCVAVRLHDPAGRPLGYAGRRLAADEIARYGKWKLPRALPKAALLFNCHRAQPRPSSHLIVVEGPWDAMRVHQAGFPNVVALWGTTASARQSKLLARAASLVVMLDGDEAGRKAARILATALAPVPIRVLELPSGRDPADLPDSDLAARLSLLS